MQMGLRINGGGGGLDTSLGDTLAAALFGDPDQARKDALARSQLQNDAYNRAQSLAAAQYQEQLTRAADEKAYRDQEIHRARINRGKVYGQETYDAQDLGGYGDPAPVELPTPEAAVTSVPGLPPLDPMTADPSTDPAIVHLMPDAENAMPAPVQVDSMLPPGNTASIRIGAEIPPSLTPPIQFDPAQIANPAQDPGVQSLLPPGEAVDNKDGTVTVGTSTGNKRLTLEQATAIGIATSLNEGDTSQANQREAGTAALLYNPNLTLSPTERAATLAAGGTALGKDSAASQDSSGGPGFNENEQKLRKEYQARGEVQRFDVIQTRYKDLLKGRAQANGVGDTVMIYAMIKMLDPTSSVMGGEQVTAQNAPGLVPAQIVQFNNLLSMKGDKFDETGRAEFVKAADEIYRTNAGDVQKVNDYFGRLATENGLKPDNVIFPLSLPPPGIDLNLWATLSPQEQQEIIAERAAGGGK